MKRIALILVLTGLIVAIGAFEEDFEGLPAISLDEAKAKALQMNGTYQAKEAVYKAAKWNKTAAISSFLPSLTFSGTYLYADPATTVQAGNFSYTLNNDIRTMALNLSQPLFVGGKLYQAYKMAGLGEELAALGLQTQRFSLLTEVEAKYLAVLQLKSVYKLANTELNSARDNLELAQLKLDNGIIARADFLRFQSNLATKEVAVLQAYTALQLSLQDFANHIGLEQLSMPEELGLGREQQMISLLTGFDLGRAKMLSEKALQLALRQNPGVKALDKTTQLSQRAYSLAKGSLLPTLMLTGSQQYKENGIDRYKFSTSNQVMLNLSIPLLPGVGNYANLQKAREEARKTALENKTAVDGIKLGVESATLNLISNAKQIGSSSLALEYSNELYAQMQERFRMNLISAKDLLDAELMLSASNLAYNNALFGYLKARSAMLQILGLENYRDLTLLLETQPQE